MTQQIWYISYHCVSVHPDKKYPVQIQPVVGELIQAIEITSEEFLKQQGLLMLVVSNDLFFVVYA